MARQNFHLFPELPPEIRHYIYLLATPPRIVHVQEETEHREPFEETFLTTPVQLELHPSIAYFAHNWTKHVGRHAPWRSSPEPFSGQTTLEAHRFTTSKPKYQPWEPSAEVPEIPLNWLGANSNVKTAWVMTRQSELYSRAPIPAVLHVCVESRASLMNFGYQLAFGTRTSLPMTWFHFGRDTLHVDRCDPDDYEDCLLLGGSSWHIGQFMPEDLRRVQRLSLQDGGFMPYFAPYLRDFPDSLRLMPNLRDLYLVEWNVVESEVPATAFFERITAEEPIKVTRGEHWSFLPVEETDCFLKVYLAVGSLQRDAVGNLPPSFGENCFSLRQHKRKHGALSNFVDHNAGFLEAHFTKELKMRAPIRVSFVHLCNTVAATLIPIFRRTAKDEVIRRHGDQRMVQDLEETRGTLPRPNRPPRACTTLDEDPWRDDWEAFKEAHDSYEHVETPLPPPIEDEPFWNIPNEAITEHDRMFQSTSSF
ncbi:hypothetical protein DL767_010291 [Monosporascus sp. MG133]|nr:hypothetical protein DL767_010291 [Monosporascus sp. MG133]